MKGKIELFYALPNIDAYLKEKGVPEQHLKPLIHMLVTGAAEYYLQENLSDVEGVIGHYLREERLDSITKETFDDLATMHCKMLVDVDEHILDNTIEQLTKCKKS